MDPSPGWYPDVTQPGQKRWFDGQSWTADRRDANDPNDDPPAPRSTSRSGAQHDGWQPSQMPGAAPLPRIQTSGLAIASVVLGLLWIFGAGSVMGVGLAILAFRQIQRSQGLIGGRIVASVGLIISLTTLGLTVWTWANFDRVVTEVKDGLVDSATRSELQAAADAMERFAARDGNYPSAVTDLVAVDYRPAEDISLAIGRATPRTFCLEALHRDSVTVWRLQRGEEPETGRC